MTGGVLSKFPKVEMGESELVMPARKEIVLAVVRAGTIGVITFYLMRWALRYADPTYQQKQKAKSKAKEIMDRLGMKGVNLNLNEHEVMIASHLVDPNHLRISWQDIAGLDDVISSIKKTVIYPVLALQKNIRLSKLVHPPKGVLLYGPPGCGKTLIAKAMAKEAKCWFINLDVSVLTDKWYGESQKLTAAVFTLAEKLQPCIIFIDEIDSLLRLRASQDHEATAMMKAQFMSLWDGLITDPNKTVIVMGATNRPKDMDAAILRRMSAKFQVPIPDLNMRKHILDLTLRNEVIGPDFSVDKLAAMTDGFSGSDLKEVARSAAVACLADLQLSRDTLNVTQPHSEETEPPIGSRGWLEMINPFAASGGLNGGGDDSEALANSSSAVVTRNMSLRAITMRDFEVAVMKLKESRSHCGNQFFSRQRMELD